MRITARNKSRRGGFTLLELISVLLMILILISILIPVVSKARRAARVNRTRRDLETIATALEAYKHANNGLYPQIAPLPGTALGPVYNTVAQNNIMNVDGFPIFTDNGAHALYSALMLRNEVHVTRTQMTQSSTAVTVGGSAPYGPFLDSGKIKVSTDPTVPTATGYVGQPNLFICDGEGRPILYAPAYPLPLQYTKTSSATPLAHYVDDSSKVPTPMMYDFHAMPALLPDPNNPTATITPFVDRRSTPVFTQPMMVMRALMGDVNGASNQGDGIIDTTIGEQAAFTGPYILWAPGEDGFYGIDPDGKSDDVTNFEFPQQFRP